MDINGVWASLNFPSQITGFSGRVFSGPSDPELGLAVTRAWNDWLYEAWWQPYPDRIIPLRDHLPDRPRARRGRDPAQRRTGLPFGHPARTAAPDRASQHVLRLLGPDHRRLRGDRHGHLAPRRVVGHARTCRRRCHGVALGATLFGQLSLTACAEWVWSGCPCVPGHQDRHERGWHRVGGHAARPPRQHRRPLGLRDGYTPADLRPAEVLQRNFWFCTIDDPSTIDTRHRIGIDHVMVEVDYPHGDSTWPDTQDVIEGSGATCRWTTSAS